MRFLNLLLLGGVLFQAAAAERPNILFLYTDDHSYRTVSAYPEAYKWVRTPAMDRLAKEGVRFASAYIGTWCMPSRAMLLTGKHQFNIESMRMEGNYPGSTYDPAKTPFWPKVFRDNGYYTAQIGKWHTGTDTGYGRDWDFQIVWNRPKYTDTSANYYYNQPITYHGGKTEMLQRYSTDQYTDWAVDFIEGKDVSGKARDKQKPWYLWLCYGAVHGPHTPADRHMKEYAGVDVETPADIFPPRAGKPDWAQKIQMWDKGPGGAPMFRNRSLSSWVQQYHQGVNALDEGFKRVLEALEKSGQKKNTLIIFTADQGLAFGQHGFRSVKVAPYDSNIRAPFVMAMTGRIKEGGVVDVPIGGIDIVPTIFKFAGIQQPWAMDGRDLTPLLENPKANWPHPAMIVGTGQKFGSDTHVLPTGAAAVHSQVPWYVMLRHGKHKYVRPLVTDLEELYDLQADPDELNNLAVKPEHQELLKQFRARAIEELRRNKAGFVDRMPEVKMAVR